MNSSLLAAGAVAAIVVVAAVYLLAGGGGTHQAGQTTAPTTYGYGTTSVPSTVASSASTTQTSSVSQTTASSNSTSTQKFTVFEREYSFSPNIITVKTGTSVILTEVDSGATSHDLIIQGVATTPIISPGQNSSVTFTAPLPGNYTFYCSVDGHRQLGMVGTLVVAK